MMTNSVTKAEISSCQSSTSTRSPPRPHRGRVSRQAPRQDRASAHHREPTEVLDTLEHLGRGGVLPQRVLLARPVVVRGPCHEQPVPRGDRAQPFALDRKSTRLNSSHVKISYAVFCLKKKKKQRRWKRNET